MILLRKPHQNSIARAGSIVVSLVAFVVILSPPSALAADSVYWDWAAIPDNNTVAGGGISLASLDGSGGHSRPITGATVDHPLGVAIDSRTGTVYWANFGSTVNYCSGDLNGGNTISFARLDGTGGGSLNTSGATVSGPDGVAIDPAAGRLYWANDHADKISYAMLNGSGGHDLNTSGATVNCPAGVAVDPRGGRVYWTNFRANTISYANLDGSGGGDLPTRGASMSGPYGLAIDPADGRIYWANNTGNSISYANLDGSGGDDLSAPGATVQGPWGVAIDPGAGRIYWANNTGSAISYANLNESGGADLNTRGASVEHPKYPALLEAPSGAGAPEVSGGSTTGSTLTCSPGTWAPDLPEAFLYRAPQSYAYRWTENGTPIVGASSSITASSPGRYVCHVAASNYAGSAALASAAFTVATLPSSAISVTSSTVSNSGAITLGVLVHAPGELKVTATCTQRTTHFTGSRPRRRKITKSKTVVYGAASMSTTGARAVMLTISPARTALKLLQADTKLHVTLVLVFTRTDGAVGRTGLHVSVSAP